MSAHNTTSFRLTIANGGTDSPYLSSLFSAGQLKALLGSLVQMVVYTPAALTAAVTMQVRAVEASGTPVTLQTPAGTDVAFAAAKGVVVNAGAFRDFRMHSAGAEAADRDFDFVCQLTVTS